MGAHLGLACNAPNCELPAEDKRWLAVATEGAEAVLSANEKQDVDIPPASTPTSPPLAVAIVLVWLTDPELQLDGGTFDEESREGIGSAGVATAAQPTRKPADGKADT